MKEQSKAILITSEKGRTRQINVIIRHAGAGINPCLWKKQLFDEIGGFNESYIVYEDNDQIEKLYRKNEFVVIKQWLGGMKGTGYGR